MANSSDEKISDFLLSLRGFCFLTIALYFLAWSVSQLNFELLRLYGNIIDTNVGDAQWVLFTLLAIISAIIGTWGVFETLRRAHRLSRIAALIGLILMGAYIVTVFFLSRGIKDDSEGIFLWIMSTVLAYWLVTSMIGLAVLSSNLFPILMRICGVMLILGPLVGCAMNNILGTAVLNKLPTILSMGIYYGPMLVMHILGFGGIGIGFLSSRFKVISAVSQTVGE